MRGCVHRNQRLQCGISVDAGAAAVENYKEMRSRDIFDSAVGRLGGKADEDDDGA